MKRILFGLAFAALASMKCSHGPKLVDPFAGSSNTRAEVYRFVQTYMEAANRSDIETMMSMVLRRPDVLSVANGEVTAGWDAIREQSKQINQVPLNIRVSLTGNPAQYQLASGSLLVVAPYMLTASDSDRTLTLQGVTTLVLVRADGDWKVLHEHNSGNCQRISDMNSEKGQ